MNYILCIGWLIKCLIITDARCKHEGGWDGYLNFSAWSMKNHLNSKSKIMTYIAFYGK